MKRRSLWVGALMLSMVGALGCEEPRRHHSDDDDGTGNGNGGFAGGVGGFAAGGNDVGGSGGNVGGSGGGTNCVYPTGPYNVEQGSIVPPTLTWQGYAPDSTTPTTISMQDFFDCDGSRNIDAVLIDTSQFG